MGEEQFVVYCDNCLKRDFCISREKGAFACSVRKSLMSPLSLTYWPMFMNGGK